MKSLDLTLPTPAENLACDEALLDFCEETGGDEVLRFWESRTYFVVVGYANKAAAEVNLAACEASNIAVLRRCTGGGTVLQGPGCLNYSLILKMERNSVIRGISTTNRFILKRHREALGSLLGKKVEMKGQTDLAIDGLKFSGNAQRRRKNFLLFHGTFLLDFDLTLLQKVLPMPSKQPDYRHNRTHAEFLTNLNISADAVKRALQKTWNANEPLRDYPAEKIGRLAREKYTAPEWNFKC